MQAERMKTRKYYYAQCNRFDLVKIIFCIGHYNVKVDRVFALLS
jgi:hypothetical protein